MSKPEPGLLVEGLETYHGKSHVLWGVSLEVQMGEVVALMGRNGAGKGRALMANPSVLLLDKPSEGLAPLVVETLGDTIDRLRAKGLGVLLCEQNHHFALGVATRAYMLEKGRICHTDDTSRLAETGALERYLGV